MSLQILPRRRERTESSNVLKVARKELWGIVASRWFWTWVAAFVALAAILVVVALPSGRLDGNVGFGRTTASLVTLVQIIIPLMGLSLGASAISSQRESGALRFLMSHPINRSEAFWGIYLGYASALAIAASSGFGVAGLITAARGVGSEAAVFVWVAFISWLLAVTMLGIGLLISIYATRTASALGVAVFVWLALVFVGDLGVMGTAAATDMPVGLLLATALLNPVETFRLTALTALSGSLDALGPAGIYAIDSLGSSLRPVLLTLLLVWLVAPSAFAWRRFVRRSDL